MAIVEPAPATITQQQGSPISFFELRVGGVSTTRASTSEIEEEAGRVMEEENMYVAVGKSVKEFKSLLIWALQKCGGKRICVLHVHIPAQMIPLLGARFSASALKEQEVRAYREIERQEMDKALDDYLLLCRKMGVRAEKLHTVSENIEKGILELISKHKIKRLVMGAAADKYYRRGMVEVKSKKAISVRDQAPPYCHIWFVCKGNIIHCREASADAPDPDAESSSQPSSSSSSSSDIGLFNQPRSKSMFTRNVYVKPTNPAQDLLRRVKSATVDGLGRRSISSSTQEDVPATSTSRSRTDAEGSSDECENLSTRSNSCISILSARSSNVTSNGVDVPLTIAEHGESQPEFTTFLQDQEDNHNSSPPSVLDGNMVDPLFDQLEQTIAEAVNNRKQTLEEAVKRVKAEKQAVEAIRKVKELEILYVEESKQREEIEFALSKEKEGLQHMKDERDEIMEKLQKALDQKLSLERQIAESDGAAKELEQKIISSVGLLENYKKERDELQMERDNALREAEELRRSRAEASSSAHQPQFFSDFSFSEIEEATRNFDPSLKIGEGGYGIIYKGVLRHTLVAVKILHSHSMQGPSEFQQEVHVLSKMRHPNLVTLVGACPEAWTLIYEYLPNGSLEDRLSSRDRSLCLSWQARIHIAAELCSVLMFLHSSKPHSVVHGDLKPSNILLDSNLVSKLSDFGICRLLDHNTSSSNSRTVVCRTHPKGTFAYMDPEFLASGELTPKSDVYSFGIILLRLMTGRPALGITKEVQYALDKGNLKNLLDPWAGDWPFVLAEQLAHLAMMCCEMNRKSRPNLASEVWRVLQPMKASCSGCGGSICFQLRREGHFEPPPYFICPIFQEVMQDPHVAADGFTYEAEAMRGWLDSGHDTSPMTNLKLEHFDLVPNRALRSAIQEWLHQQ